jgi:hypothetical protein
MSKAQFKSIEKIEKQGDFGMKLTFLCLECNQIFSIIEFSKNELDKIIDGMSNKIIEHPGCPNCNFNKN